MIIELQDKTLDANDPFTRMFLLAEYWQHKYHITKGANEMNSTILKLWQKTQYPQTGKALEDQMTAFEAGYKAALAQPAQVAEPVAIVDASDNEWWADILPDQDLKIGQLLYAAPIAAVPEVRPYLTEDDMASLMRFDECCEDSDSGGHDVPKDCMKRLCEIGVVRAVGFGRSEMTAFGRYVIECHMEQKSSLPLLTFREYELAAAPKQGD